MFTVLCKANQAGTARLGLAISKKHCRRAAARNRIKRIIRESFRHRSAELEGLDIVVMNAPNTERATNRELFASLDKHWQRCLTKSEQGRKDQE